MATKKPTKKPPKQDSLSNSGTAEIPLSRQEIALDTGLLRENALQGRRLLVCVSASIAAYKAADLCSQLSKAGAEVQVVLTEAASQFVGAATFRALTRRPVLIGLFDEPETERIAHIDAAQTADLVIVAPASANVIAKLAHGIADDMLTTCLLATPASTPLIIAPAMNTVMWEHPATRANVELLALRGVHIVQPSYGLLACQDIGTGKLASVDTIMTAILDRLSPLRDLAGYRLLVTAGATREPLDPVRFLSNRSSGKMGFAVAERAARRGADVTLVSGFTTAPLPNGVRNLRVETADEMYAVCMDAIKDFDLFIGAAAVADYTPQEPAQHKIKKSAQTDSETLTLNLRATRDILAAVGAQKRPGQFVVGFAAETADLIDSARRKLHEKNADLIVANDVTRPGAGFDIDTNIVTLIGREIELPLPIMPKRDVADRLLDEIHKMMTAKA